MKLLITGCPRSGTKYISKILIAHGLDFGHEESKEDGMSNWKTAFNDEEIKNFDLILHQVRHPLKTINSMRSIKLDDEDKVKLIESFEPKRISNKQEFVSLEGAMNFWYLQNLRAEKISKFTYSVENLNSVKYVVKLMGIKYEESLINSVSVEENSRKSAMKRQGIEEATWEMLSSKNLDLTNKIIELGKKYGYT